MGVYTFRVLYAEGAGKTVSYEVPAKKRVVVRSMMSRNGSAGSAEIWLGVHGIYPVVAPIPAWGTLLYPDLSLVAYERETVTIQTTGTNTHCIVTGYIFDDPLGKPASGKPVDPGRIQLPQPEPLPSDG